MNVLLTLCEVLLFLPRLPALLSAAYGGCFLVKKCAELAFSKHRRSMLAGDMIHEIPTVFQTFIEPQDD